MGQEIRDSSDYNPSKIVRSDEHLVSSRGVFDIATVAAQEDIDNAIRKDRELAELRKRPVFLSVQVSKTPQVAPTPEV